MKATGIVRRIDDLGRVVIPKEIRRTMGIKEGEPLEIFIEGNMVCFKRYCFIDEAQWSKAETIACVGFNKFCVICWKKFADFHFWKNFPVLTPTLSEWQGQFYL